RAPARRHRRVPLGGRLDAQPEHRETSDRCRRGHAPHGARLGVPQRPATGRALRAASCRRQRSRSGFPAAADAGVAAALLHRPRYTTARPPQPTDSLKVYTLPPAVVSVTRANPPINRIPQAVQLVEKAAISRARPTWGLDEALVSVPGVYAANRYNFSLDQRISIRGFGARSAFAVRGVKVIVDGIPQTLPDGQSQLTNLEL